MSLKEKMFRKSIGEKQAELLQTKAPQIYAEELKDFMLPDYIQYNMFGQVVYSPEMAEE